MSKFTIVPKNWDTFQHYKDRKPAWIKLHRDLLDNYEWYSLPLASRALAPCIWLIASEYEGGLVTTSLGELAFRLRTTEKDVRAALITLIQAQFFILEQDASGVLAECLPRERVREREEKEGEEETDRAGVKNPPALIVVTQEPEWYESHPDTVLTRIVPMLLACESGGKKVFLPPTFKEEPMIRLCDRLRRIAPDVESVDLFFAELAEYCAKHTKPPYSDPARTVNNWLDKREVDWLRIRAARAKENRAGSAAGAEKSFADEFEETLRGVQNV